MTTEQPSDSLSQPTGSPLSGEPVFVAIGKLHRPHGVHGEIVMEVLTEFPERVRSGMTVYIGQQRQPMRLRSRRQFKHGLLLAFQDRDTLESVADLRSQVVYVRAENLPELEEGEYYHHQLLGLRVFSESGADLGRVTEILETGSNDVLVVGPPGGPEILLPATDEVMLEVDLQQGRMRVHILPGILPDERETDQ